MTEVRRRPWRPIPDPGTEDGRDASLEAHARAGITLSSSSEATWRSLLLLRYTAPAVIEEVVLPASRRRARSALTSAGTRWGRGCATPSPPYCTGAWVEPARMVIQVGSTGATPQHLTAGSWGTATVVPAADAACDALLDAMAALPRAVGRPFLEVEVSRRAPGQPEVAMQRLVNGLPAAVGLVYPEFVGFSHVAHFVEVRVEPTTRRVRVPRVVSVADCGRVISPRTAASQLRGGVVWGIGAALREVSEVDPRHGGFLNAELAEYVLPVRANIGTIELDFVDEPDPRRNGPGVKGLGEVAMVGVAPAIANAVHHATGRRLQSLPIRLEDLF